MIKFKTLCGHGLIMIMVTPGDTGDMNMMMMRVWLNWFMCLISTVDTEVWVAPVNTDSCI